MIVCKDIGVIKTCIGFKLCIFEHTRRPYCKGIGCDCQKGTDLGAERFGETGIEKLFSNLFIASLFFGQVIQAVQLDKGIKTVRGENESMGDRDFHVGKILEKFCMLVEHCRKKGKSSGLATQ